MNSSRLGFVAIGRNEGERLRRCLSSISREGSPAVYVDSGSADKSVEVARALGWDAIDVDTSLPFTAARGRNAGFDYLMQGSPGIEYVQFVDGDCELVKGWIEHGQDELRARPEVAIVAGRLRERQPEASIYSRLCDLEWQTPEGAVDCCGGIFMIRAAAFRQAGGFNAWVPAGEEPDLCLRLCRLGWKVVLLPMPMALHECSMTRFSQWWKRATRSGYGYAQAMALHGGASERFCVRQSASVWFWALLVPLLALSLAWPTRGISLLLVGAYPALALKIAITQRARVERSGDACLYALHCVLGKWPELCGQVLYLTDRLLGRDRRVIEPKRPGKC